MADNNPVGNALLSIFGGAPATPEEDKKKKKPVPTSTPQPVTKFYDASGKLIDPNKKKPDVKSPALRNMIGVK